MHANYLKEYNYINSTIIKEFEFITCIVFWHLNKIVMVYVQARFVSKFLVGGGGGGGRKHFTLFGDDSRWGELGQKLSLMPKEPLKTKITNFSVLSIKYSFLTVLSLNSDIKGWVRTSVDRGFLSDGTTIYPIVQSYI